MGSNAVALFFGLLLTLVVAMVGAGTLNALIERVAYRPLRSAPKLAPLITAVGILVHPAERRPAVEGRQSQGGIPDLINAQHTLFTVFGVTIENADVLSIAVTIPLLIVMTTLHQPLAPRQGDARDGAGP